MDQFTEFVSKRDRLQADFASARHSGGIALKKTTSNLFRRRDLSGTRRIDVRSFNRVIHVDPERRIAEVEGMTRYDALVDATLRHGLLPTVVPQLKTITIGGAVSGLGIESSSFRFGLVHETVEEMEILLGSGETIVCSRNENADLFYGFPNSYGTLGYVLRLKVRLIPAPPCVKLTHTRFTDPATYVEHIQQLSQDGAIDYLDGTIFSNGEMYATTGEFVDSAPYLSDYTYLQIYYKSIQSKKIDYLSAKDYIWRWDTDWFWCSKQFGVQNPVIRVLAGKWALNSEFYHRVMRVAQRRLPASKAAESVIQDVDIPIEHAVEFFEFLLREIRITPVWVCPFRSFDPAAIYDLYALDPNKLYINFGFWDMIPAGPEPGWFNRKVERKALELNGKKGLYSTAWYDEATFWRIYNKPGYDALKRKYDPTGVFKDLYQKCVREK